MESYKNSLCVISCSSFHCSFLARSSPWLQQRAHPVPASHHCVEETSRSTAGLQHPWGQGVTVRNLHIQGACSPGVFFFLCFFYISCSSFVHVCAVPAGGTRFRCPQSRAAGGRPGSLCKRRGFSRHRALESKSEEYLQAEVPKVFIQHSVVGRVTL